MSVDTGKLETVYEQEIRRSDNFYVYVHIRKSDGVPFYVGKGTKTRAWQRGVRREPSWNAVAKAHGVVVCLYRTELSDEDACALEIDLIQTFRVVYPGALVNVTSGGYSGYRPDQTGPKKQKIREFVIEHGRLPSEQREQEYRLGVWTKAYCRKNSQTYDPSFRREMEKYGYGGKDRKGLSLEAVTKKQTQIKDFYEQHGRFPIQRAADERPIYIWLMMYCAKTSDCYDPEFHVWAQSKGYGQRNRNHTGRTNRGADAR